MIPDEAVEVVARWLWDRDSRDIVEVERPAWDELAASSPAWAKFQEDTRQDARAALEAAAPHMLGEQVTTRVEQANLPNGTVVLTATGDVLQHFNGYWFAPGSSYRRHLDEVALPATVLHKGAAK